MSRTPVYRTFVRAPAAGTFGRGTLIAEFENSKHLGWAEYINAVGESFWTVNQGDRKIARITDARLNSGLHVEQYRDNELVWGGWLGETSETETDVIFHAYSWEAGLFWLHTGWNIEWSGEQIDAIVTDCWTNVALGATNSGMAWMSTGTIEAPVTTSGGATPIVLPSYHVNYKRILFVLQELAAMATSDTTNRVLFEITPAGQFNFWKNRGTTRTDTRWEYGGAVMGYARERSPMERRNVIFGVGAAPNDIVLRNTAQDAGDHAANQRREEAIFYSWIRDEAEVDRINKLRLARALRDDDQLALSFVPGRVIPARATGAHYALGDYVPVKIDNGMTQVDEVKLVTGQQIIVTRGQELVRAIVQDSL